MSGHLGDHYLLAAGNSMVDGSPIVCLRRRFAYQIPAWRLRTWNGFPFRERPLIVDATVPMLAFKKTMLLIPDEELRVSHLWVDGIPSIGADLPVPGEEIFGSVAAKNAYQSQRANDLGASCRFTLAHRSAVSAPSPTAINVGPGWRCEILAPSDESNSPPPLGRT